MKPMKTIQPLMKKSLAVLTLTAMMGTGAAYAAEDQAAVPISSGILPISGEVQQALPINSEIIPISAEAQRFLPVQVDGSLLNGNGYQGSKDAEPMIPLRAVAEQLGFSLQWNQENLSVDLSKGPLFTTVKTGEDRYAVNRMYTQLGSAPALVDNKLYVPASFVSKVLNNAVTVSGGTVSITSGEPQKTSLSTGVITAVNTDAQRPSIQIQGAGLDGIILHVSEDTVLQMKDGSKLSLADLHVGLTVEAEHSLAMTLSLPGQTAAYVITVQDSKRDASILGTAGEIMDVRTSSDGSTSYVIKGTGLTDQAQDEIVLQLTPETVLVGRNGEKITKDALVKGTQVIGFYGPRMTKSLPPIGTAWKIAAAAGSEQ